MKIGSDQEVTIFTEAAGVPIEQRDAFLVQRCRGDEGLLRRVKALLSADATACAFLESPLGSAPGKDCSNSIGEKPGEVLGRYKLLQQIGEGGWGVVFMAEQEEPVRGSYAAH